MSYIGPGDLISGAAAWAGLRAYNSIYSGPALNVRRSSDNTTMDVGLLGTGALDTTTLATFLNGAAGFVTTLYDQTSSGRNFTQSTLVNQPGIAIDPTLQQWVLTFNGTQWFDCASDGDSNATFSLSTFFNGAQSTGQTNPGFSLLGQLFQNVFGWVDDTSIGTVYPPTWNLSPLGGTGPIGVLFGEGADLGNAIPSGWNSANGISNDPSSFFLLGNNTFSGAIDSAPPTSNLTIGFCDPTVGGGPPQFQGALTEVGLWNFALTNAQATALGLNQSNYWFSALGANGFVKGTYGYLQYRIADELGDRQALLQYLSDSGLSGDTGFSTYGGYIQDAIFTAIAKWERERFYFNELLIETQLNQSFYPWSTVQNQEYYSDSDWSNPAISSIAKIDKMWVLINANRYALTPRVFQYMADTSVNPAVRGFPTDYAWASQQIRFYPIPDNNYPIGVLGTKRLPALVNLTDQNAWTQDAFDLIRCEAKQQIARDFLHNQAMADEAEIAIYGSPTSSRQRGYLSALKREAMRIKGSGGIRPTHF